MEKIKFVIDKLDVEEICLSIIGDYSRDCVKVETKQLETGGMDIVIIQDRDSYVDKIYGREIQGAYYFARHEFIDKEYPYIDYYEEFFSCGIEL